ncbi:G-type lectin S-receptor-like serine/threonine-protein kinase At2g19130 [Phragmites australis]|uniref:G-type lectin S-receptor-like serine/threonine-protein kinase At2g19130 n=1 Tax=Phragmites australis TaxID=29695 RepID=UPI002D79020B|nr:G-type lectin S-receptor-like serine/threonine-protein kinase At2g19130 [Phragmites australis]
MCASRHVALLLLLPCLSLCPSGSAAANDTLAAGGSLTGNRTLVSAGGQFELGFFSPPGSAKYYVGIWYKQIPVQTAIWAMNRDVPVSDPSSVELTVAQDGSLVLLVAGNRSKEPIWSSNSTGSCDDGTVAAVLLDTGNLQVLCGRQGSNTSAIIWQSFDHPTDTLVPGGWVELNKSTGAYQALRSWRSATDPSTGLYMDQVDPHGSGRFAFLWNGTVIYHYVGAWNGRYFNSIPEMVMSGNYKFIYVDNEEEVKWSFQVTKPSTLSRMVMSPHGQITMFDWSDESGQWLLHWATPTSQCDVYSLCGPFGLCDVASSGYCRCLPGFEPASPGDWVGQLWSSGCKRKTSLQCSSNASTTDGFLPVQNVQMPSGNFSVADAGSSGGCAAACLRNCSCTAYAYKDGCLVWGDDLRNVQQLSDGNAGASTLFLRVAAADLAAANQGTSTNDLGVIVGASSAVVLAILCLLFVLAWARRHEKTVHHDGSLLVFSYGYLAQCTKNYSQKLGMGSFGSVYKGTLPDHTVVAVKRLEGSAQGEKQFRTEVRTLGTIQHVNLVRLQGFCATKHERLLVYDYMPNGSLASLLSGHSIRMLDWSTRFRIMAGVARGLAYLHEKCQERIVHCDVKPENILLDADFCPKVADFGMAKLIGRDFSQALTTARGTIGYLAPEWILGLPITAKADVYSYGMMLLELISGRRNRDTGRGMGYFPLWAATKVGEGRFLELLDERLAGDADVEELSRACNVACWCIQQAEPLRPTMGQVVQVLEGSLRAGPAPVPRYLEQFLGEDSCTF